MRKSKSNSKLNGNSPTMWCLLISSFVVILFAGESSTLTYKFVVEDVLLAENCRNVPSNVLNLDGLLDRSDLTLAVHDDYFSVAGNATFIWDIQPGDRVEAMFNTYRFERGSWQQTPFSISVPDICPILYDKEEYWYKFWTKHVLNYEAIKDKCFSRGTTLIHEAFDLVITMDFKGLPLDGRYKLVSNFKAFNAQMVQHDTSICFEIVGVLNRK